MQIAERCFGISTAAHALIQFADGEPAYITRRFDRTKTGETLLQEDFCQLSNDVRATRQEDFKYQGSYEELGHLILRHSCAPLIDVRRFFTLVVFNMIFSNGDAHKKNFSFLEYAFGDYRLSPAYDLLCTRLHFPNESRLALDLFADDEETPFFAANGFHGFDDLVLFAGRLEIPPKAAQEILLAFPQKKEEVLALITVSSLTDTAKTLYRDLFLDRLRILKTAQSCQGISL